MDFRSAYCKMKPAGLPGARRCGSGTAALSARPALLALLLLFVAGCGGSTSGGQPTLIVDSGGATAVELYDLGTAQLALGNLDKADEAFRASLAVARKSGLDFAPPHEGMARVLLRQNKPDQAEAEAMHAQELDPHWTPVYWILGKLAEQRGSNDLALVQYERGLIDDPGNQEILAAAVDLLTRLGETDKAREVEERSRNMVAKASRRQAGSDPGAGAAGAAGAGAAAQGPAGSKDAATRQLLAPFFPPTGRAGDGSDPQAALTPAVLAVFQQTFLTRGALAILITGDGRHGLAGALDRSGITEGQTTPPADTGRRPEDPWINRALAMGLMETFPDNTFRPDQVMTRQTLCLWVEETIARLRNDQRVFRLYRDQKSPFPDIPDDHYALNAVRIAVDLKLLEPLSTGAFALDNPIRVEEGVEAVRRLGPALLGNVKNR